jgi:hypothetical protein
MSEEDKILLLPEPAVGKPRRACAYCERSNKFTTLRKSDDLIDFCPNCVGGGNTYLHIGCIRKLHASTTGHLHCTNPGCLNLFSEKYNHLSLRKSHETKNALFYRLFPVLWLGAGLSSAVFALLYDECIYRSAAIECYIVAIVLEVFSALMFIAAYFGKLSSAGFYLRFTGSKVKADQRLNIELTVVITCTMFGLFPILTLAFLFNNELIFAIWVFFFHFLLLPAALWKTLRYITKMKIEVANINVTLVRNSVLDLRSSREQFKEALATVV